MSEIVDGFLTDHSRITDTLLQVQKIGVKTEKGRELILLAKDNLLAHLAKEDAHLYPVLLQAAESDDTLKSTLEKYAKDMDQISASAMAFFDKYSSVGHEEEFEKDCKGLIKVLCKRIRNEEAKLYTKYNEIMD